MQMKAPESGVTVRMYSTGFGDCFLLAFRGADGDPVYMLIDCGVHSQYAGGGDHINAAVKDIQEATGGSLAVIAITHEHADHISGFAKCREQFEQMKVDDVWFAWTEKPGDPAAEQLKEGRRRMFTALKAAVEPGKGIDETARGNISAIMGFFDGLGMT